MIKRTIEVSERAARISLRQRQMILKLEDAEHSVPCEDIGVLVLQNPAISLSAALLDALLESGAVVVICNKKHHPSGLLLPTISHTELVPRMMAQLEAGAPARKQAWKAIIQAKILAQARQITGAAHTRLQTLAQSVKSGDPDNCEAQAARIYWPARFPDRYRAGDKRDPTSESLFNAQLNYGYAIIRAAVARALVSAGLQPALGVFHHKRDNAFCLADDVMEPLRPLVDRSVSELWEAEPQPHSSDLQKHHRQALLSLLAETVTFGETTGPLMAVLPRYVASFYRLLTRESDRLTTPTY